MKRISQCELAVAKERGWASRKLNFKCGKLDDGNNNENNHAKDLGVEKRALVINSDEGWDQTRDRKERTMAIKNKLQSHSASTENVSPMNLAQATNIPMEETLSQAPRTTHSAVDGPARRNMETQIKELPLPLQSPDPAQASSSSGRRINLDESSSARPLPTRSADGGIICNQSYLDGFASPFTQPTDESNIGIF